MHLELNLQSAWALKYSILQTYYNAIVELWLGQYSVDRTFQSHLWYRSEILIQISIIDGLKPTFLNTGGPFY